MKAMILAAGKGSRLSQFTQHTPKPLFKYQGQHLLHRIVNQLLSAGIKEIIINVNYLKEQIISSFQAHPKKNCIQFLIENETLETGGGIENALPLLGKSSFLLISGKIITDFPFTQLLTKTLPTNRLGHLILIPKLKESDNGDFSFTNNQTQTIILDKTNGQYIYSTIGIINPTLFEKQKEGAYPLRERFEIASQNDQLSGEIWKGQWESLTTTEDYMRLIEE